MAKRGGDRKVEPSWWGNMVKIKGPFIAQLLPSYESKS